MCIRDRSQVDINKRNEQYPIWIWKTTIETKFEMIRNKNSDMAYNTKLDKNYMVIAHVNP